MITPTDLWIAYAAGLAGGLLLPVSIHLIRLWRARRTEEIERAHWRALNKFRG